MILASIIHFVFLTYTFMLFGRIIGSWFPSFQGHPIMRFVNYYTEPYLKIFRKIIPPLGMLDLSPIAAFFALQILEHLILGIIR